MIYLDNAATSFPKPEGVYRAVDDFMRTRGGNPGRSGHRLARAAQGVLDEARTLLAELLNAPSPERIVFTLNCTDATNTALKGLLNPGDEVIASGMEHNAVARPLHRLAQEGVGVRYAPCDAEGLLNPAEVERLLTPRTRLIVVNHASNVCGTIQRVQEIGRLAREHGALFMIDAAQTLGALPVDVQALSADLVAFPGHKCLYGPTGTGGLYVAPGVELRPLREGGTGARSELLEQPRELPLALEAGTANVSGLAGLVAGLRFLRERTVEAVRTHEQALAAQLWQGLSEVPGVRLYGPADAGARTAVVSFTLAGWDPADLGAVLDSSFNIAVRPGLHCAPLAHRTLGTLPDGTVRMSCGAFNTAEDIAAAIRAVTEIASSDPAKEERETGTPI